MQRLANVLIAVVLLLATTDDPCAQTGTCTNVASAGAEGLQGWIATEDQSCQAVPSSYVKSGVRYRLDFEARAEGSCELRAVICSPFPCECKKNPSASPNPQLRSVDNVKTHEYNAGALSPYFLGMVFPTDGAGTRIKSQFVDTRQGGTNGPTIWTPFVLGKSIIRWTEIIYTTQCNIQPGTLLYGLFVDLSTSI